MAGNKGLRSASKAKKDEFYTQLSDIENELRHYRKHFKDATVLCNCDDPFESNFFKFFALNFNYLGLKKLIATCYVDSPVSGTQMSLFSEDEDVTKKPHKIEIACVDDVTGDGAFDMSDVEWLIKNDSNVLTTLEGDGDFRSDECIELMQEADIVVTNPPFSLFREYVTQLIDMNKKFLIIGNQNAITYKEIFPLLKENKMWLGNGFSGNVAFFSSPYEDTAKASDHREGMIRVSGVMWFTNMDIKKRHEKMDLFKPYKPEIYPKYDNFDAINIDKVVEIPCDYDGLMGVPITFLTKYNPDQFEIVDALNRYALLDTQGTNEDVARRRSHTCNIDGKATYYRIIIRNLHPERPLGV